MNFNMSFAKTVMLTLLCLIGLSSFSNGQTTWYVRADGGTRYSQNRVAAKMTAQCNGRANKPYSGDGGTNEDCAYNDFRFLYDDQATYNTLQWVIAGGDNVIIDSSKPFRVGWDHDQSNYNGVYEQWCSGGSNYGCFNPTIPAGTVSQPTRILGANYASCNVGNAPDKTKMSQLFGGHGAYTVLNMHGAQNVQVECLEITSHSSCIVHGSPLVNDCHTPTADGGIQDYDGDGIITDPLTSNVLLQDMWIHGHTDRGIIGAVGGAITTNRVDISTNGMAGWDFDPGDGTKSVANSTITMHYSTVEYSGCNQEYPLVHAIPITYCYDQNSGGYGDGVGTPSDNINVSIDHSLFQYNTQDGADFGHDDIAGGTLSITNSMFVGNMGAGPKWGGGFTTANVFNNLIEANSLRMSKPLTGAPTTYNQYLSAFARSGDAVSWTSYNASKTNFIGNTIVTYSPTTFDFQCGTTNGSQVCDSTVYNIIDNLVLAYDNPATYPFGGQAGGPGLFCGASCNSSTALIGVINRSNNFYYGLRGSCAANVSSFSTKGTVVNEKCADPEFVNEPPSFISEATLDNFNFHLSSGSPAIQAGITNANIPADYFDTIRLVPTAVGGVEYTGVVTTPAPTPTPTPVTTGWTKVATEGDVVQLPASTVYRYGATGGYTASFTASAVTTITVNNGTFGDPDPNYVKELDVQGTGAGVIVNGVPFLPAAPVPSPVCILNGYTTQTLSDGKTYKLALCQ